MGWGEDISQTSSGKEASVVGVHDGNLWFHVEGFHSSHHVVDPPTLTFTRPQPVLATSTLQVIRAPRTGVA